MYLNNLPALTLGTAIPWDLVQQSFWPILSGGIYYTIPLTILSFIFGMILALITALARMSKVRPLIRLIKVLDNGGIDTRNACGKMTRNSVF